MANKKQKVVLKFKDDAFVEQLVSLLMKAGKVKVDGIGIFEIVSVKERTGYSIATGKPNIVPAHMRLKFRPTVSLRDLIQEYGKGN